MRIRFSARKNGNCDRIAGFLARAGDTVLYSGEQNIHPCANCDYECFRGTPYQDHVLGIQRQRYGQKMGDSVLDVGEVKTRLRAFGDQ